MTATDAVKLFYDYVAIFFVVYLVGYSTFLLLAVAVGSSELYTRRRQEKDVYKRQTCRTWTSSTRGTRT